MILFMDRQRAARAVAARRGELRMTQQELAAAAGVDSKTIGNLERRGRWPIARSRALIEKALHWPLGEMERIASEEEPPEVPEELMALIDRMSERGELPPVRRQLLIDRIRQTLAGELAPGAGTVPSGRHRRAPG